MSVFILLDRRVMDAISRSQLYLDDLFLTIMTNLSAWVIFHSKKVLTSVLIYLITTFQKDLAYSVEWGTLKGRPFMGVFSALLTGRSTYDFMQFLVLIFGTREWNKMENKCTLLVFCVQLCHTPFQNYLGSLWWIIEN